MRFGVSESIFKNRQPNQPCFSAFLDNMSRSACARLHKGGGVDEGSWSSAGLRYSGTCSRSKAAFPGGFRHHSPPLWPVSRLSTRKRGLGLLRSLHRKASSEKETRFSVSESIFKICQPNQLRFSTFPDNLSRSACAPLHQGRTVYEERQDRRRF